MAVAEEAPEHHMEEEAEVASMVAEAEASEAEVVAEVLHAVVEVASLPGDAVAPEVAEVALALAPRYSCKAMTDSRASMLYVERTMLSPQRTRLQEKQFTTRSESARRIRTARRLNIESGTHLDPRSRQL